MRITTPRAYHSTLLYSYSSDLSVSRKAFEATAWHEVAEDLSLRREASSLGLEPRLLLALNTARLKGLTLSSLLLKGTILQVKEPNPNPDPDPNPNPEPEP